MGALRPAVILDRDGVLNVDTGYVHKKEDVIWIAGAMEAVRLCQQKGFLVIVITNQSGIGRGFFEASDVDSLHLWMASEAERHGGRIGAFYYCPHAPDEGCACRKPRPGLFFRAIEEWALDARRSFSVGDKDSDIAASSAAGIRAHRFRGGNLAELLRPLLDNQGL